MHAIHHCEYENNFICADLHNYLYPGLAQNLILENLTSGAFNLTSQLTVSPMVMT